MNCIELYKIIEIPEEVIDRLLLYGQSRTNELPKEIFDKLLCRNQWDEGIKELSEFLKDDDDGIKALWGL